MIKWSCISHDHALLSTPGHAWFMQPCLHETIITVVLASLCWSTVSVWEVNIPAYTCRHIYSYSIILFCSSWTSSQCYIMAWLLNTMLILFYSLHQVASVEYYITANSTDLCTSSSCLTLTEFVANIGNFFDPMANITVNCLWSWNTLSQWYPKCVKSKYFFDDFREHSCSD